MRPYNKNENIDTIPIKRKIIKYLMERVKTRSLPMRIANKNDLDHIEGGDYIVCPQYEGTRSWIIFVSFDQDIYAVSFPKRRTYDFELTKIFPIDIVADPSIYSGTIMEGIYNVTNGIKTFIVDDMYYLAGQLQITKSKDHRLQYASDSIRKLFGGSSNFRICVAYCYQIQKNELESLYNRIKTDSMINEIIFYPKLYGVKIYKYIIMSDDVIDKIIKTNAFVMRKTKKSDIYELLDITTNKKIDIAIIPDMHTSKMCKKWFVHNKTDTLTVKCQYIFDKKKWMPLKIIN